MSRLNNENLWNQLVAYIFGQMSVSEETAMDDYLEQHEEAAEVADDLLTYCEREGITDQVELNRRLANDKAQYRRFFSVDSDNGISATKRRFSSRRLYILILLLIAVITLVLYIKVKDREVPVDPPSLAPQAGMIDFWNMEKGNISAAGESDSDWEKLFLAQQFQQAAEVLETNIAQQPSQKVSRQVYFLCAIYLWNRPPRLDRLQELLPRLDGTEYVNEINRQITMARVEIPASYLPK